VKQLIKASASTATPASATADSTTTPASTTADAAKANAAALVCDIAIIGAGPAGLSFALCLARSGLSVCVLDQQAESAIAEPAMDGRDIAMNHQSKQILEQLGVWQRFPTDAVHPLKDAKVIDGNSPYTLHFERNDNTEAPLGYLVANHQIRHALYQQLRQHNTIQLLCDARVNTVHTQGADGVVAFTTCGERRQLRASLVVGADSRFSAVRRMMGISARMKDYGRVMMVCNMTHELDHQHTARECFFYGRTCAILPLGPNTSSIVITTPSARAAELAELSDDEFARQAEQMLKQRLGKMTLVSQRYSYPLVGAMSSRFIGRRFALIGDAAVGMHPVTAHGYNLGLRSADTLAGLIIKAQQQGKDIASPSLLLQYEVQHKLLSKPVYDGTNLVVGLFTDDNPLAKVARKLALRIGNNLKPFKQQVSQRLIQTR
jgi:ubiquinone biosynthesis UbiH/UbiF/VisC/COQ6 family hydroxylase